MTTATITGSDLRLRDTVVRQLEWDPGVDASAIGVTARDGTVTLTGFVDNFLAKLTAERVVKRVRGVRAVANDITVRPMVERSDDEIAHDVAQALRARPGLADAVQAAVHRGHVTLTGTVEWLIQKEQAERWVKHVSGLVAVHNHVTVKPASGQRDVRRRIVRALHDHADLDARKIVVRVSGDVVTLSGTAESWMQRDAAERAAGSAPGITRVDNQILVEPAEPYELEPPDDVC